MGRVIGDHKIAFGAGKTGRVLFIDAGALRGRRALALFSAKKVGEAESYEGHVVLASETGTASPEAFPVQFSVRAGDDDRALAAALTTCAHIGERSLMPNWDGIATAAVSSVTDMTNFVKNFSGENLDTRTDTDPRVIRTGLPYAAFRAPIANANARAHAAKKAKSTIMPAPDEIGVRIGDPEPAFVAREVVRRLANPAAKVGEGPILAPEISVENAQAALAAVRAPSVSSADYYGAAGVPAGDTRTTDRQQAAKSFPVLAEMIANTLDLSRAVDARAALQPLIIEKTGLTKGALKRLSKITQPFDTSVGQGEGRVLAMTDQLGVNRVSNFVVRGDLSLDGAIEHLKELPPDWVPETNEAWAAYADILGGLAVPLSHVTGRSVKDLLSSAKGDWVGFKATLAKAADVPLAEFDRARMSATSSGVMDMVESLARTAILPMVASISWRAGQQHVVQRAPDLIDTALERAIAAAPNVVIGRSKAPIVALLEAERRYISRDTAINGIASGLDQEEMEARQATLTDKDKEMGDLAGNKAFPVLRERWVASNGYEVIPFRNEQEMQTEGAFMGHCVGGHHRTYGSSGAYHYFSVRHPDTMGDPKQRGTLRIHPISPGSAIREGEFRSHHNSAVNAGCRKAFKEWTESFLQEDLDAAGARMDEWRAWRKARGLGASEVARTPEQIWEGRIGVKVGAAGIENEIWQEWATNVLSGWSAESPEVMFRNAEVRDVLSSFSPQSAEFLTREAAERKAAAEAEKAAATEGPSL